MHRARLLPRRARPAARVGGGSVGPEGPEIDRAGDSARRLVLLAARCSPVDVDAEESFEALSFVLFSSWLAAARGGRSSIPPGEIIDKSSRAANAHH